MRKGDFCIIPPHTTHMLYTQKGYTQLGMNLNSYFDGRGIVALLYNHINKPTRNNRIDIFDSIHELKKESESLSQLSRLKIAVELDRIVLSTVELIINNKFDFKNKLLSILKRELNSKLMLQDLCKEMSLSQTHLERLTHKEFGCGVIELFNQLKINLACTLLSTSDKNIKEISDYLGFCDQAYFCRLFKIKMKMTPKEYSKRCAN
jgi:AraC-like DNA-binding protein